MKLTGKSQFAPSFFNLVSAIPHTYLENEDTALDRDMNEEDATAEVAATLFENNAEEGGENDGDAQWA